MHLNHTLCAAIVLGAVALPAPARADIELCLDESARGSTQCVVSSQVSSWRSSLTEMEELAGVYLGLRGGYMQVDDVELGLDAMSEADIELEDGYVASGAVGYQFSEVEPGFDIRVELELGYQKASIDQTLVNGEDTGATGDAGVVYGFLNTYGDLQIAPRLEFFAGGGVGAGVVTVNYDDVSGVLAFSDEQPAFGYHVDLGFSYQVKPDLSLDVGYRFSSFLDVEATPASGGDVDLDSHQLLLGLRFRM